MEAKRFMRAEAFRFGWEKMKKHFWLFMGIFVVVVIISGLQNFFSDLQNRPFAAFLGTLAFWAIGMIANIGMIRIALQLHDGTPTGFDQLFADWRLFFKYLFGTILYSLIVMGGLILLIVPGVMWSVRFQLCTYFIVDKGAGPVEALKLSSEATKGARMDIFWFDLACFGVMILGILALVVGIFAAMPTIMMAGAYVYRKLQGSTPASSAPVVPATA
jgi:uncharacterized membrane protein